MLSRGTPSETPPSKKPGRPRLRATGKSNLSTYPEKLLLSLTTAQRVGVAKVAKATNLQQTVLIRLVLEHYLAAFLKERPDLNSLTKAIDEVINKALR
jgi:hypothetical protein